ncbi:hypothetical protein GCM10023322_18260 [Rugosimonospora acidiphila]|uniref:DUF3515 domain-containing protein n=1 Tax=Rugosimonospora acidiphila TaxID=556531 RepID=A0ABP9RP46_9ACTN
MADSATRGAARTAAFIAVPIALVAGLVAFRVIDGRIASANTATRPSASATPGPQSTSPVQMAAPQLADGPATVCRALLSKLPDQIQGKQRRAVTAGPEQNAAYGDPALTLGCGAAQAKVPLTAEVWALSNVCWYEQDGKSSSTWTTVDRTVPIQVTVPNSYGSPGQLVIEFSAPVASSVQALTTGVPSGCSQQTTG